MSEIQKIKPSGIFTNYIFKSIPLAFDESMSYYETLCALLDYLKTTTDVVNNNADLLAELELYVKNYFDNLDVQAEINNKLDEMAEQGELQEIISEYLNSTAIFGFDNVQSMKNATNLINGSYAQTCGYYVKNDGGKALYKIRTITNNDVIDEMKILSMDDESLIAELIESNVNAKQIGCKTDGTDNSTLLNNYFEKYDDGLYFPDGEYTINYEIDTIGNVVMSNNAWLKAGLIMDCMVHINKNLVISGDTFANDYPTNQEFKINVDGNKKALTGIRTDKLHWSKLILTAKDCEQYGVYTRYNNTLGHAENTFDIQTMYDSYDGENTSTGVYINGSDDIYNNVVAINTKYGVEIHGSDNSIQTLHCWLVNKNLWTGSVMLKISNHKNHISNLIIDTYETGIGFTDDYNKSTGVFNYYIDFMFGMINEHFIDDATLRTNYKLWDFTGLTGSAKNNSSLIINSYVGTSSDTSKISLGGNGICPFNTKLVYGDDYTTPKWLYNLDYCPEGTFGFTGDTAVVGKPTYVTAGNFILKTNNGSYGKEQELMQVGLSRTTGATTFNTSTIQPTGNSITFYKRILSKFGVGNSPWGQFTSYFVQEPTT